MSDRPVVVITGSRTLTDKVQVIRAFAHARERTRFARYHTMQDALWLHGGAAGVDTVIGEHLEQMKLDAQVMRPDYDAYGKGAPLIRNGHMVELAAVAPIGAVIAVWDGKSTGTANTIKHAARLRVPCYVEVVYPHG
jgi:hypothetical protein